MQVVQFIYNETNIDFSVNGNVMVNATQMAKVFGKDLYQFTKSDNTKRFIDTCLKPANAGLLSVTNEADLIKSKQKSGTWMHRVLALKFAAWLDPEFELWVYSTIDKILLGSFQKVKEAMIEQVEAKNRMDKKRKELIEKSPEIAEFFAEELKMTQAERKRAKAMKEIKQGIVLTGHGFDPIDED
jgi:hypothetical protein